MGLIRRALEALWRRRGLCLGGVPHRWMSMGGNLYPLQRCMGCGGYRIPGSRELF